MLVGLHLTKCAGTSLITLAREKLYEDEYYLCSSYIENFLSNRPMFLEVADWKRIRFVFGHYVNEDLVAFLHSFGKPYLFTVLRDPVDRAISDFLHQNAVARLHNRSRISAAAYLSQCANSMCMELTRCFPSATWPGDRPHVSALRALEHFDYIGLSHEPDHWVGHLFGLLDIKNATLNKHNVTDARIDRTEFDDDILKIKSSAENHFAEDLLLYNYIASAKGNLNAKVRQTNDMLGVRSTLNRIDHYKKIGSPEDCAMRFGRVEARYAASEIQTLGQTQWGISLLERRIRNTQQLLSSLKNEIQ